MTDPVSYSDPRDAIFDVSAMRKDLGRKTGRAATTIILFAFVKLVIVLGTTLILARLIPPDQQGIFALAIPAIMIAAGLSEFGLAQAVVQRETVTHELMSTLFWVNVALGILLMGLVMLLGNPAVVFFDQPAVAIVFIGLAPYVLFMVLTTPYVAILRRQMNIKLIETSNLVALIASSILAIVAALLGAGLWALILQFVLNPALTFFYLFLTVKWRPSWPWKANLRAAHQALAFGGFLAAERLLSEFVRNIQIIIIGRYFTDAQVGLFYRSQTFALMPHRRIGVPLSGAFVPSLARLQNDEAGFRDMFIRQITRANLIIVPIGLMFCLCADAVVRVLLGPDWAEAAPILAWLAVLPMTAMLLAGTNWTLVACGKTKQIFHFGVFNAILITASLYAAAQFGLIALVATSVLVPTFISLPVLIGLSVRLTPNSANTYFQTVFGEVLFVATTLVLGFTIRHLLDWTPIPESFVIGFLIVGLMALRIMLSPSLRRDAMTVFNRKKSAG